MPLKLASVAAAAGVRAYFKQPSGPLEAWRLIRRAPRGFALLSGLAISAVFAAPTSASAAPPKGYFVGDTYGTYGAVKASILTASLGPTAYVPCPCLGTNGQPYVNRLAGIFVGVGGKVLKTGLITSTVTTTPGTDTQKADNISRVEGVYAFDGLITAKAIQGAAHTLATKNAVTTGDAGSSFVGLAIAGKPIQVSVAPNTRISLAGLGYVTLKRELKSGDGINSASLSVDMIAVTITQANTFGLPIGAVIVIGHTQAGYVKADITRTVSGRAFATSVSATDPQGAVINTGLTAFQPLGCLGTDGKPVSNYASAIGLKPLVSTSLAVSTATGKGTYAQTQSRIENASLLGGIISATALKAVATTYIAKGVRVRSTDGTSIAGLKVLGIALPVKIKPNTKIGLPGIGYVVLNEQLVPKPSSTDEMVVNTIHVVVNTKNLLNLPIGAQIIVGHAASGVMEASAGS